jgi:hypothetical protein
MILMMDVDDDDDVFDAVMIAQSTQTWFVVRIVVAVLTCRLLSYFVWNSVYIVL